MMTGWIIAAALGSLAVAVAAGWRWPRIWLGLTSAGATGILAAALVVLVGGADWTWRSTWLVAGEQVLLRLDAVSAWFLTLVGVVGGAGAAYARGYWSGAGQAGSASRGRVWWSALVLSMGLVLSCANGLHFLIAWEAFALSAYFLITLERDRSEVRAAGWLYLAASHAGTLALFAFFATLAARTGNWELGPMHDHPALAPLFWLALAGFGVKAGMVPLHIWLPPAHANAPGPVSAIMSGVAIKMGLFGLVRYSGWMPLPDGAGWVVLALGSVSAVLGAALALAQTDIKRLLAYSSVENMGVMTIGLGAAIIGVTQAGGPWTWLVLAGALAHAWNHACFKSLLFLGSGSVVHATGTREMSRLGGLWRAMPWTASLFTVGAVSASALPPLNGFVSEWLVYLGLFDAAAVHHKAGLATLPAAMALGITGALALAAFVKAAALVFVGAPRTRAARHAHECGWWMRGPMLALAIGCAFLALAPALLWPLLARVAASWHPAWVAAAAPSALTLLGGLQAVLALALVAAGAVLWRAVRRRGSSRGPTWDCGYVAPSPRMQYTGGSFDAIVSSWTRLALRPRRRLRRPRGVFPRQADHVALMPDVVLENVVQPAGRLVLRASAFVRRLQHGRLQDYILYLVAGIAAITAIVVFEGKPWN